MVQEPARSVKFAWDTVSGQNDPQKPIHTAQKEYKTNELPQQQKQDVHAVQAAETVQVIFFFQSYN
jgi:hypothetical protein